VPMARAPRSNWPCRVLPSICRCCLPKCRLLSVLPKQLKSVELDEDTAWETLVANIGWAAEKLADEGITLCLEAINSRVDMPRFFLDTSGKVIALIEEIEADNVRLQYDIYHMQIMHGDLVRSMECLLPWIGHIQFADNPGRHEPGTGEINFSNVFSAIDKMDYDGWVSAEYRPSGTTAESLYWLPAQN